MTPDTVFNSRRLLWIVCFSLMAMPFLFFPTANTAPIVQGKTTAAYCMMGGGGSVVYFTPAFDTKLHYPARIGSNAIAREFLEYLKGRYDVTAPGNFPSSCPIAISIGEAEATRQKFEAQACQEGKQVVQVDWRWVADAEMIAASISEPEEDVIGVVETRRKKTHTYCLSDSAAGTLYTAGPVDTGTGVNLSYWHRGFDQMLRQKYSFNGQVYCNVGSPQNDERMMGNRIAGARAAGKKIVSTGWKYDSSGVATTAPSQRDDDPEPVQRPAPVNPSRQASDNAAKELPASKAYCQKDPTLSAVFICDNFARVVYNYRMAHVNEAAEPVASLVATHKLNCAECIDNVRVSLWTENRARTDNLSPKVTNCVSQNVIVTLYKTPEASQLREFYKQAVATCSKQ